MALTPLTFTLSDADPEQLLRSFCGNDRQLLRFTAAQHSDRHRNANFLCGEQPHQVVRPLQRCSVEVEQDVAWLDASGVSW
jgi:hypothetical protein